ncbi:MAG: AAA family ATPase, partial [Acidobacteria bacterium]|nr:AAA family ATPase [Acidobacteriota bacterium]
VIGTSTSGHAARTLGREAEIVPSRTLASLSWRLEHGRMSLGPRTVVVCDESSMTTDADLLRLLLEAETAGAKVVMVGDHRQLGAVGPGGSFEALCSRFGAAVHVLDENVRQRDPAERTALGDLRAGDVWAAVDWYAANGRMVTAPDRDASLDAVVAGWSTDVKAGSQTTMLAWKRTNVVELNRRGRETWDCLDRLSGPELIAPGGAPYRAGDRVVTLAPGARGEIVTSECGSVFAVDPRRGELLVRMDDDGRLQHFAADGIDAAHLAHGYAVTAHRAQGSTVDRAHVLEDGGGRELAYVKMSRARERSTVYTVADSLEQAVDDLKREWSYERRIGWAIDRGTPARDGATPAERHAERIDAALLRGRLRAERDAVAAAIPPDPLFDMAEGLVEAPLGTLRSRRWWRDTARRAGHQERDATARWSEAAAPELGRLGGAERELTGRLGELQGERKERAVWLEQHPEAARRLERLGSQLELAEHPLRLARDELNRELQPQLGKSVGHARVLERPGPGLGIGW